MIRTDDLDDLLQAIDRQNPVEVTKQNLFDNPVRLYMTVKALYLNYKKNHQLQIMQQRVFSVCSEPTSANEVQQLPEVSASCLFQYHQMSESDILLLIEMKDHLKQATRDELYQEILKGIERNTQVKEFMNCYRTLLNHEFVNKRVQMYSMIQEKMIKHLLSLESLTGRDVRIICHKLAGLPLIKQPILLLISRLYQKINNLKEFRQLYLIFQANFPEKPALFDIQALFRICIPETLSTIKTMLQQNQELRPTLLEVMEREVKHKLNTMDLIKTNKTQHIINLIVQAVKLGIPVWQEIIEWEHRATQQPKNMLKNSLESILVAMLRDFNCLPTVVTIIDKITQIDQHSEIGLIFVRQLLKLQTKEYLAHRTIRRFLAIKILKYNSSEDYTPLVFDKGLKFVEVILGMFKYKNNVISFYQNMLNSQEHCNILESYLKNLAQTSPVKYRQFFFGIVGADTQKNELLGNAASPMLRILTESVIPEVSTTLIKELALIPPSKGFLIMLTRLIATFKDKEKIIGVLKSVYARALNIMLVRTDKSEISKNFQIQFPSFIKEYLLKQSNQIFINVPEGTKEELKKTYENYSLRKKPPI